LAENHLNTAESLGFSETYCHIRAGLFSARMKLLQEKSAQIGRCCLDGKGGCDIGQRLNRCLLFPKAADGHGALIDLACTASEDDRNLTE
jgi:hypothetical protein